MNHAKLRILVTGADGFIGKNLTVRLAELSDVLVRKFVRGDSVVLLRQLISNSDFIVHLAGENRPQCEEDFSIGNARLTAALCDEVSSEVRRAGRNIPILFASSIQADRDNAYGRSKLAAEKALCKLSGDTGNPCVIFRLPGVFGKWCRPDYNSVVATFCHNISRGLPIQINDPSTYLRLVYVDDVVSSILLALDTAVPGVSRVEVQPEYSVSLGELADKIKSFDSCRSDLHVGRVGVGFLRALYATYVSYIPSDKFVYDVPQHADARGVFVEMLKTPDSGQFSYFTAYPGVTRGGHYHHTKTEKFLVIRGEALFRFRNLITGDLVELRTSGSKAEVVDTIPGWTHDVTNIGREEMVVMLWSNENFDRQNPDTVARKVG